jgi:hypothetical protein|tara:strand:+ start:1717 stop:2655 length:939 start_codon:yes stop_codon:yes gene_type:complete
MASKQVPQSGISNQLIESDFGRFSNDFIQYCVYDSDDNYITSKIIQAGSKSDLVELNPGKDLRDCGLIAGKYRVEYKFLRQRGGKPRVFFVDEVNEIWNGDVRQENGKYFKGAELDLNNSTTREEVFVFDDKYQIHEISPSRTEIRIIPKSSEIAEYNNGFASLGFQQFRYNPILTDIAGDGKIDKADPFKFVATLDDSDGGFKEEMVGAEIEIQNAFIVGYEETVNYKQVPNPNFVASLPPGEPIPENKFDLAKEIAKEREDVARAKQLDPIDAQDSFNELNPLSVAKARVNKPKTSTRGARRRTEREVEL